MKVKSRILVYDTYLSLSRKYLCVAAIISFFYFIVLPICGADFKVQRGVTTVSGTSAILTAPGDFTAVSDLTKAFVRITNSQHTGAGNNTGGGNQNADDVTAYIQFDSASQITISRNGNSNNTRVNWEIVEYIGAAGGVNEIVVRDYGIQTLNAGTSTNTTTFSGAASTSTLVGFVAGVANSDTKARDYESGLVTLSFDNASTLRFTRGGNDAAIQVSYAVVDFIGSAWSVQRVEHTYSSSGVTETESLSSSITLANSFIHTQKRNNINLNGLDEFGHQAWLSGTNQLSFQLYSSASTPSGQRSVAWVISNPYMNVYRNSISIPSGGAEPWTSTITVTAVADLTNSSIFWNNDCAGTGTAFPRAMVAVRLTAVDTIEMWRSDTGQPVNCRFEVVEWPEKPAMHYYVSQSTGSDTTGDGSAGTPWATIAYAITQAADSDTIEIQDATHTEASITVDKGVAIIGSGADNTVLQAHTIKGGATDRIFNITSSSAVTIRNMTIRHGVTTSYGGAVSISSATVSDVSIEDCKITDSSANAYGGAIYNYRSNLVLTRCTISGNLALAYGGAIYNEGTLSLTDCTLSGNSANGGGGAVAAYSGGTAIFNSYNSTISGNQASNGGGIINNSSTLNIYNSTIFNNTASVSGGGIGSSAGTNNLYSTIVAGNTASTGPDINASANTNADHCLIEDTSGLTLATDTNNIKDGAATPTLIAALADNEGPTQTHALQAGSPAVNNGSNPQSLTYDQRGTPYLRENNGAPDIGSYESQTVVFQLLHDAFVEI